MMTAFRNNPSRSSLLPLAFILCFAVGGCATGGKDLKPAPEGGEISVTDIGEAGGESAQAPFKSYSRPIPDDTQAASPRIALNGLTVENRPIPVNSGGGGRTAAFAPDEDGEIRGPDQDEGETVTLNFDNADIYEVIRTMAEILKINYIVDPTVQGNVTIHTAGRMSRRDLFSIFSQILDANGLTAIPEGNVYRIGKSGESAKRSIPLYRPSSSGRDAAGGGFGERVIMQIIPLKNIDSAEMAKLLTPFMSNDGTLVSHSEPNILILVDRAGNIAKAMRLVDAFDIDVFHNMKQKFYPLRHTNAEEVVQVLESILTAYGNEPQKNDFKIIAVSRLNTLLVVSANMNVFQQMDTLVRRLDVPNESVSSRIYVYFVKNGEASELADLLMSVFQEEGTVQRRSARSDGGTGDRKTVGSRPRSSRRLSDPVDPFPDRIAPQETAAQETLQREADGGVADNGPGVVEVEAGVANLKGDLRIIPDIIRNALIIDARPGDYQLVENILRSIDVLPRQVLIEATIAEVTLDASTELGVEWSFDRTSDNPTGLLTATIGESGLAYTIGLTEKWTQALNALATNGKVNILSAPTVLASDNKQAQINVSTSVPLATTQFQYSATDENPIFQTTIQYRDTGIILEVTPRINDRGLVSMDIRQEISDQAGGVSVGGQEYPSFFERVVQTTLTVKDDQTIVLGGLMTEKRDQGDSGVPFFKDLPYLGYLFGKKQDSTIKTELIILLTPRVIVSLDDVDAVSREFRTKVGDAIKFIR
ncbi:type II secretion system secretin GspD [Desulfococcus sp.]|uniref:type II secretion system secretin GspD n=1 Tax=Desulfococcus sp. TaxID=2025834 RepID=UPI0035944B58